MKLNQSKISAIMKLRVPEWQSAHDMKLHTSTLHSLEKSGLAKSRRESNSESVPNVSASRTAIVWKLTPLGLSVRDSQDLRVGNGK